MDVQTFNVASIPDDPAESLARLREATARWVAQERTRARLTTGVEALDGLLGGGWPQGRVGELIGPPCSGRTAVAMATVAAATSRGEVVAWVDAADAFDPVSATAAGVELDRVLWVRPGDLEKTVRAAELCLDLCGFGVVVVDLAGASARRERHGGKGKALRLVRAAERAGAVVLVLAERAWVGTLAGVTVALGRGAAEWRGGELGAPHWLVGISLRPCIERGGVGRGAPRRDAGVVAWKARVVGG